MRVLITIGGSKTAAATINSLIDSAPPGTEIHALFRNLVKVPKQFSSHPTFHAVQGTISDAASLDFAGSDVVLAALPPIVNGDDPIGEARKMCENVKTAVEKSGTVRRLVLLSSIGAEFDEGTGELLTNHVSEEVLSTVNIPEIIFVRCAYFMENWTASLDTLKGPNPFFFSPLTPLDYKIPMVATKDIGSNLARLLLSKETPSSRPQVYDLQGPTDYSAADVQLAFSNATGKNVQATAIDKDKLSNFFCQVFPPNIAGLYVEMTQSILPGGIAAVDSPKRELRELVRGGTTLQEAIREAVAHL